jgi:hypothetical protein
MVHTIGKRIDGGVRDGFVRASKESIPIDVKSAPSPPTAKAIRIEIT